MLSIGKEIYSHGGIIGLGLCMSIYDGYNDIIYGTEYEELYDDDPPPLTPKEIVEISEHMIGQWEQCETWALASMP